jgi:hypothetical protein
VLIFRTSLLNHSKTNLDGGMVASRLRWLCDYLGLMLPTGLF